MKTRYIPITTAFAAACLVVLAGVFPVQAINITAEVRPGFDCANFAMWDGVAPNIATLVPVYAGPHAPPTPTRDIDARVVISGADICFFHKWADATKNPDVNDVPRFADAVAVQWPFNFKGLGSDFLAICPESYHMGALPGDTCGVNIIFWRADLAKPQNMTGVGPGSVQISPDSSPYPEVTAMNINTLPIAGFSKWETGFWTAVIKRPLAGVGPNMVSFTSGMYPIAFSQWDAALREVNGRKYVSDDWGDNLIIP